MGKERNIRVRPVPHAEPDLRKLARAIIDLAIELNEQDKRHQPDQQRKASKQQKKAA